MERTNRYVPTADATKTATQSTGYNQRALTR